MWRGVGVARRERLRPIWRLGLLIGLLHLLPPVARAWGRLRIRWPYTAEGTQPSSLSLRSAGRGLFLTEGVEESGRSAFLEGLRNRLQTARLQPKMPSGWEEADLTCNSTLFWRAHMVSYEAWGVLYLILVWKLRYARLTLPALGLVFVLVLWWSVAGAAGAIFGLLVILLLERWLFARRIRRALTEYAG
jgi:hypothetical protein